MVNISWKIECCCALTLFCYTVIHKPFCTMFFFHFVYYIMYSLLECFLYYLLITGTLHFLFSHLFTCFLCICVHCTVMLTCMIVYVWVLLHMVTIQRILILCHTYINKILNKNHSNEVSVKLAIFIYSLYPEVPLTP